MVILLLNKEKTNNMFNFRYGFENKRKDLSSSMYWKC
jgi:hypothetical protein